MALRKLTPKQQRHTGAKRLVGARPRFILKPWQVEMLKYLRAHRHGALFVDPRLGKTLPTCMRILQLLPRVEHVLIAAPHSALFSWEETLRSLGEDSIVYLTGTQEQRKEQLHTEARWNLINKEGYRSLPGLETLPWDVVVLDESHFIKNPQSQVTGFWMNNFRTVRHRYILTGTPNPESQLEFYCQLSFLDERFFHDRPFWAWRDRNFIQPEGQHSWYIKYEYEKELTQQLADRCFFKKRYEVRGREKIYVTRKVAMAPDIRKMYDTCEEEMVLELPDRDERTTVWSMQKFLWLRQLCSGIMEGKVYSWNKLKAVEEYLRTELRGTPTIIYCAFIAEVKALAEMLGDSCRMLYGDIPGPEREHRRMRFQQGDFPYIVAQPDATREGVDLSRADTCIYFSTPMSNTTRIQSEDRVINLQKERLSLIADFVMEDTIEEDCLKSVKLKEKRTQRTVTLVRGMERRCPNLTC